MSQPHPRKHRKPHTRHPKVVPGAAPGSLRHNPDAPKPSIHVVSYSGDEVNERTFDGPSEVRSLVPVSPGTWIDVTGLGDVEVIREIAQAFDLHRLALEDVLGTHQRPKLEEYVDHVFVVARVPYQDSDGHVTTEQLSLFIGNDHLLSFTESASTWLEPVRKRIRQGGGRVRTATHDYLAYAILDTVIDMYFPILESVGDRLEAIEETIARGSEDDVPQRLQAIRRTLSIVRRAIWPLRNVVSTMVRDEGEIPQIFPETRTYLRDCEDHTFHLLEIIDGYRELAGSLMDYHQSAVSNKMNEVMKVLTIISTIFIPLSFVAGVYGMNFDADASPYNMPELGWRFGYLYVLSAMAAIFLGMLLFFKRRGWF